MDTKAPLLSLVTALALAGCSSGSVDLQVAAASGEPVSAQLSVQSDGSLHVDRLLVRGTDGSASAPGEDDDDIECEDGVAPDGSPCEDDEDATAEDDDEEDDDDGDDATAEDDDDEEDDDDGDDATAEEDDDEEDDDDGDDATAEEDDDEEDDGDEDGADHDGDGDVDDEDARYATSNSGSLSFVQGSPAWDEGRNVYNLLGIDVNPGAAQVPDGAVRFDGGYSDGYLAASSARSSSGLAIGGTSEGIVRESHGIWTLSVLGQSLIVDDSTEIVAVSDPVSGEEDGDDEGDGIDCEQEGEHEGENEGC
ncbi:MAG: hypothetical protein H6742_10155 [Alphaproteobacteria bacterium]|nr:hypothetical protein [Alphaproteobacteria bacterium]